MRSNNKVTVIPRNVIREFNEISYSDQIIKNICDYMTKEDIEKVKYTSEIPFSIIRTNDGNFFAVYRDDEKTYLGKGSEGKVKYVKNLKTNEVLACKISKHNADRGMHEVNLLKRIGDLKGYQIREVSQNIFKSYLITNLGSDNLSKNINQLNENERLAACYLLLQNLLNLHNNYHISHGDYLSSNILFNPSTLEMKVIDFGKSVDLITSKQKENNKQFDLFMAFFNINEILKEDEKLLALIGNELFKKGLTYQEVLNSPKGDWFFTDNKYCDAVKDINEINFDKIFNLIMQHINDFDLRERLSKESVAKINPNRFFTPERGGEKNRACIRKLLLGIKLHPEDIVAISTANKIIAQIKLATHTFKDQTSVFNDTDHKTLGTGWLWEILKKFPEIADKMQAKNAKEIVPNNLQNKKD